MEEGRGKSQKVGCHGNSHEELRTGRVVTGRPRFTEPGTGPAVPRYTRYPRAGEFLAFQFIGIPLPRQPVDLRFQLLHLVDQLRLLVLQNVFLLNPLEPAALSVPPVLQGPPLLFQTDHLVLGEPPEVPVQLPHRHRDELVVGEPVLDVAGPAVVGLAARVVVVAVVVVAVVVEGLVRVWGYRRRGIGVLAVVVVVLGMRVAVRTGMPWKIIRVMSDASAVWMVVLRRMAVVAVVVVWSPVAFKPALLHLLLDMRGWGVTVGRGSNQGLHRVLRGQAQRLRVYLLVVPATRHPIQLLQVILLLRGAETRRGWHRAARRADGGGGDRALGLKSVALADRRPLQPGQAFFLNVELHEVEIVDVFQS